MQRHKAIRKEPKGAEKMDRIDRMEKEERRKEKEGQLGPTKAIIQLKVWKGMQISDQLNEHLSR